MGGNISASGFLGCRLPFLFAKEKNTRHYKKVDEKDSSGSVDDVTLSELFKPPFFPDQLRWIVRLMQLMCTVSIGVADVRLRRLIQFVRMILILYLLGVGAYQIYMIDLSTGFSEEFFVNINTFCYNIFAMVSLLAAIKMDQHLHAVTKAIYDIKFTGHKMRESVRVWAKNGIRLALISGTLTFVVNTYRAWDFRPQQVRHEILPDYLIGVYKTIVAFGFNTSFCLTVLTYTLVHLGFREAIHFFNEELKESDLSESDLIRLMDNYWALIDIAARVHDATWMLSLTFEFYSVSLPGIFFFLFLRSEAHRWIYVWLLVYSIIGGVMLWIGPLVVNEVSKKTYRLAFDRGTQMDEDETWAKKKSVSYLF